MRLVRTYRCCASSSFRYSGTRSSDARRAASASTPSSCYVTAGRHDSRDGGSAVRRAAPRRAARLLAPLQPLPATLQARRPELGGMGAAEAAARGGGRGRAAGTPTVARQLPREAERRARRVLLRGCAARALLPAPSSPPDRGVSSLSLSLSLSPNLASCAYSAHCSRLSAQGFHPNDVGYEAWGGYIAQHLLQRCLAPSPQSDREQTAGVARA